MTYTSKLADILCDYREPTSPNHIIVYGHFTQLNMVGKNAAREACILPESFAKLVGSGGM
jgi:hypothetical protein